MGGALQLWLCLLLFQATVQMEDGKVVVNFPHYKYTAEIMDGKLVEVSVPLVPGKIDENAFLPPATGPKRWSSGQLVLWATPPPNHGPGSVLSTRCT